MSMNVLALMELLKNFPPDIPVLLSSDEEGNSIRHLSTYSVEEVEDIEQWEVELIYEGDEEGEYEEAVVLWP
ncbi:hypothetical protein HWB05_gp059 [Streptomyces phage BRock]|uniref:Uncharacterized protein n=1 Tax=Streptomyces phage BRock TaxID=1913591 RepID=A0A1J0GVV8_9CAUD|nr:hypothetical protein HWB05_gp059 [Streptomyces phage BRock]APC46321.1 hypothetical protein [Streptomyces phage BRock]